MSARATQEYVIDTCVLQKANAPLMETPRPKSGFARRLALLKRVREGEVRVVVSNRLVTEYQKQIPSPRNDFIQAFIALLLQPDAVVFNWSDWRGSDDEKAGECRFPNEDKHVLRTANGRPKIAILTEEKRMLDADDCVYREFRVHVWGLEAIDV